ncbi:sigma-70 family RNA polymerase sigma factor [Nesterenkonia sp. E16_7]|nr:MULTISPECIES: sigma-70 family RNA polymerase sigma factor [unclassified Nesterenkonia]MBO0596334.1 sigma-70 family RNA polymerase sigma factor [Nesterenkonia sp. E16_10]MBO0597798.1 sigma-70 family RNA polymerase sigma factor [Nesterenkonia sp. E16_7]
MNAVAPDLGALYLRHRDTMYRIAASVLHRLGRESEAEDVVHDAITSILASPPQDVRNWEAYLVKVVKRRALDRVRSAEVRHSGPELDESIHDRDDGTDMAEEVAEELNRQTRAASLSNHLVVLDVRHRKAVWDFVALRRPRSEIAAELGVTPARVTQMKTRALERLLEEVTRGEGTNDGRQYA